MKAAKHSEGRGILSFPFFQDILLARQDFFLLHSFVHPPLIFTCFSMPRDCPDKGGCQAAVLSWDWL